MNDTSRWTLVNDRVLELALGLALILVGLFRVLLPILGVSGPWSSTDSRTVRVDDAAQLADATASAALTLRGTGHAEMVLTDPGLGDRLLLALPGPRAACWSSPSSPFSCGWPAPSGPATSSCPGTRGASPSSPRPSPCWAPSFPSST
ncbi:hypothetical protein WKI68_03735 [Streptomyces sp. MS1.HAVA.3]|uniref:Uncharacterized protein n=1 Tax=Streptomyces caledonius TaxID=3134107 RepID=A0ABU8TYV0_9ACTN